MSKPRSHARPLLSVPELTAQPPPPRHSFLRVQESLQPSLGSRFPSSQTSLSLRTPFPQPTGTAHLERRPWCCRPRSHIVRRRCTARRPARRDTADRSRRPKRYCRRRTPRLFREFRCRQTFTGSQLLLPTVSQIVLSHRALSVQGPAPSSKRHWGLQPSPAEALPSSQASPASSAPLPQVLAGSQLLLSTESQIALTH